MSITVKIFATLRLKFGISELSIETEQEINMIQLLELVETKIGAEIIPELIENDEIMVGTILLIDGKNVLHAQHLKTIIPDNCVVSIFPPVGGG